VRRIPACLVVLAAAGCGSGQRPAPPSPSPSRPVVQRAYHAAFPLPGAQRAELRRLRGRPVYCGGGRHRIVALTFDDGPGPYTRLALKELGAAGAHATFFVVAKSVHRFPGWPRREAHGAALGDHTATHALLPLMTPGAMHREIAVGRQVASRAAGVPIRLFRPPYGAFNADVTRAAARMGMTEILWSVDSGDSIGGNFHAIAARVRDAVRPGAIVLFHENRGQTIRALRSLLPWLERHHYRTASVPELLAADPPAARQLQRGVKGCGR
jgi:peptidoglycan/xylan/chitin deacetylase (PgdA/CDA1 family)